MDLEDRLEVVALVDVEDVLEPVEIHALWAAHLIVKDVLEIALVDVLLVAKLDVVAIVADVLDLVIVNVLGALIAVDVLETAPRIAQHQIKDLHALLAMVVLDVLLLVARAHHALDVEDAMVLVLVIAMAHVEDLVLADVINVMGAADVVEPVTTAASMDAEVGAADALVGAVDVVAHVLEDVLQDVKDHVTVVMLNVREFVRTLVVRHARQRVLETVQGQCSVEQHT